MAIFGVDMMGEVCVVAMAGQAMSGDLAEKDKARSSLRARCFGIGVHVKGERGSWSDARASKARLAER